RVFDIGRFVMAQKGSDGRGRVNRTSTERGSAASGGSVRRDARRGVGHDRHGGNQGGPEASNVRRGGNAAHGGGGGRAGRPDQPAGRRAEGSRSGARRGDVSGSDARAGGSAASRLA